MATPSNPTNTARALAGALLVACIGSAPAQPQAPDTALQGLWITESGNLEIDIAPCGPALCGTVVRVLANKAMANPAIPMPAASTLLGKILLSDLAPAGDGNWQGSIFNRANNKTYRSRVSSLGKDQLKVLIYEDAPEQGQTQVWRRSPVNPG